MFRTSLNIQNGCDLGNSFEIFEGHSFPQFLSDQISIKIHVKIFCLAFFTSVVFPLNVYHMFENTSIKNQTCVLIIGQSLYNTIIGIHVMAYHYMDN